MTGQALTALVPALTAIGAGLAMVLAGLGKKQLEWRPPKPYSPTRRRRRPERPRGRGR